MFKWKIYSEIYKSCHWLPPSENASSLAVFGSNTLWVTDIEQECSKQSHNEVRTSEMHLFQVRDWKSTEAIGLVSEHKKLNF